MNAFCILFSDTFNSDNLGELTAKRNIASMPFGGRYRLVDFMLSNLVNSFVPNVGVIAKDKYSSLADHLSSGKDWGLNRKNGGIKILTPYITGNNIVYRNKFEALCNAKDYIGHMLQEYCIIADANIICNIDLDRVFDMHIENDADMTVIYTDTKIGTDDTEIFCNDEGKIIDALYHSESSENQGNVIMKVYILKKSLLNNIIDKGATFGWNDINKDFIAQNLNNYKIIGYKHNGYNKIIRSLKDFYQANMDLLKSEVRKELFETERKIFTQIKDSVPTFYGDKCHMKNSLIADGCKIDGYVENSIIFRDVKIEAGSWVKNSVIMKGCVVKSGAAANFVVADKNSVITENQVLVGSSTLPFVIKKGTAV